MGRFVVKERKDRQYIFQFISNVGYIILTSEGYSSKSGIKHGINLVRKEAKFDSNYMMFRNTIASTYSFILSASNGLTIGKSDQFKTIEERDRAIIELKSSVDNAKIDTELNSLY